MFRSEKRELTRLEYTRLLEAAARLGRERLVLLMEAICATGIRVSELQYITVEAGQKRPDGNQPEGENPYDLAARQALPEAASDMRKNKTFLPAQSSAQGAADCSPVNKSGQR